MSRFIVEIVMETHPKHFWSEARNLFVISTSLQENRSEYFWLLHTQDSLIQSYKYLQFKYLLQISCTKHYYNLACGCRMFVFFSRPSCLRICAIIVCHPHLIPTQFALTCPSVGHNQLAALWCPGIPYQLWPIPPITLINVAQ